MAVITQTIQPGERRNEVTEIQKALISLGANIDSAELFTATTPGTYGPTTQLAVAALIDRFGVEHPTANPFRCLGGTITEYRGGGGIGQQRGIKKSCARFLRAYQTAPVAGPYELAWLARYAVMALDFTTARKIATQIPNEPVIKEKVSPIVNLTTLQPPAPELLNPENY